MGVTGQQVVKKSMFALLLMLSLMLVVGRFIGPLTQDNQAIAAENKTLIFGDSITKGAESALKDNVKGAEVDAVVGRSYAQGKSELKKHASEYNKSGAKVVVALGTNNGLTKSDISEIKKMYDKADLSFVDTYVSKNASPAEQKLVKSTNEALSDSGVNVIKWSSAAKKYLGGDGIHPNPEGSKKFASLVSDGISGGKSTSSNAKAKSGNGKGDDDKDEPQSYASKVFDNTKKNASKMYYNSQIRSGAQVDTVQSVVNKTKKGEGEKYAAFLQGLHNWNLYKTYTTQTDLILSYILILVKAVAAFIILACLVVGYIVTAVMSFFANLMEWLNIFKFMENGVSNSNPLHAIINPIVDILHSMGYIGMVVVTFLLGITLAMFVMGIGRATQRATYLGRNGLKILTSIAAIFVLPFLLATFISSYAGMVKEAGGAGQIRQQITNIPKQYIVDTEGYIGGSLDGAIINAAEKGNKEDAKKALTYDGYVLKPVSGMPESEKDVYNKVPTSDLVENINEVAGANKANSLNSAQLVIKWFSNRTLTPNDIDSQHHVSDSDKGKEQTKGKGGFTGWAQDTWIKTKNIAKEVGSWLDQVTTGGKHDAKRMYQFKLSPGADSVKVFDGKRAFSGDLNEVSIQSASVAGNGFGSMARTFEMVCVIAAITTFVAVLLWAVLSAVVKSISMFLANIGIATFGSIAGVAGVVMTATMLAVSTITALFLITVAGGAIADISNSIIETANSLMPDAPGVLKQFGSSIITSILVWALVLFLFKARRAIVSTIEGFFKRILDAMGLKGGENGTRVGNAAHNAVSDMAHAERDGAFAPEHLKDLANDGINGYNDRMNHMEDSGQLSDSSFANFKEGLAGAKEGMAGGLAGKLDEAYSASKRNDMPSVGGFLAGKASNHLNKAAKAIDDEGESQFTNQENAADELDDARSAYTKADKDLADAETDLEKMKAEGASADDIDAQQAKVDEAKGNLAEAEQNLDEAAGNVVDSGATAVQQEQEEAKMADMIRDAETTASDAEAKVAEAEQELENMEAMGATDEEIAQKQAEIGQLTQEAKQARQYADDLKEAGSGAVHDADGVQDAVNEKAMSDADVTAAEQALERVEETGGLTDNQLARTKNSAKSMDSSLGEAQVTAEGKAETEQAKLDGMKHIQSNGGQAFSNADIEQQGETIKTMGGQLAQAESKLQQLEKSGFSQADVKSQQNIAQAENAKLKNMKASGAKDTEIEAQAQVAQNASTKAQAMASGQGVKEAIQEQQQHVETLRSNIATQNQIKSAMSSGKVNQGTVASGEQIYESAKATKQAAETHLDNINARHQAGESVSRTELANAQTAVQQATQQEKQAKQVLTGLKAQHATGGAVSEQAIRQQAVKTDQIQQEVSQIKEARQNLGEVINGQGLSQAGVQSMAAANQIVQSQAKRQVQDKQQAYSDSSKALQRAEQQAKSGRISATELGRIKKRHEMRGFELKEAEQHAQSVINEGKGINQIGQYINKNIDAEKANVAKAKNTQNAYSNKMSAVARRGGLGKRSTNAAGIKQNIDNERNKFRARPNTYANSLRSSAARAQRNEERYVNKGLDQRRRSPMMHDAININRKQNDRNHPDYNPKESTRETARQAKMANRAENYD